MSNAKPLTAEEEMEVRDACEHLHQPMWDDIPRLLATLDAERAARAEAEAKVADLTKIARDVMAEVDQGIIEKTEDATAKRIAEWLRTLAPGDGIGILDRLSERIERGEWRR